MPQHIKDFLTALKSGKDMDYIANNGYQFSKDELIKIAKELLYTAYQESTDGGCLPECEEQRQNYEGFIRRFIDNMNEYEDDFFKE